MSPLLTFAFREVENVEMMFATMNAEEQNFLNNLQSSEATLRAEVVTMRQMLQQAMDAAGAAGAGTGGKGGGKGNGDERGRALLNREDFGLVDKFEGNPNLKVGCLICSQPWDQWIRLKQKKPKIC